MVFGMAMRRNPPNRDYPPNTHLLDRTARLDRVLAWVQDCVARDGGRSTFIGFGRSDERTLRKVRRLLPDNYSCLLSPPTPFPGEGDQPTWRQRRNEHRLIVTLRQGPTHGA